MTAMTQQLLTSRMPLLPPAIQPVTDESDQPARTVLSLKALDIDACLEVMQKSEKEGRRQGPDSPKSSYRNHLCSDHQDFMAGMKTLVGGEIVAYTEMLNEARQIAVKRMVDEALELGADAVIGVRYSSAQMMQGAAKQLPESGLTGAASCKRCCPRRSCNARPPALSHR